jgi:glucose-1-phosphate adenylyltransferase
MMGNDSFESLEDINEDRARGIPQLGIGARCHIQNAIIDKGCRIGDDVRIMGGRHLEDRDDPLYTIKDGVVVVKKGAVMQNGFTLGL